ncbi:hypothetical protein [Pararhodonellum marinum]|uniref:hypothetical protein n=1 Tax=Pararhodonellum marinum TaxID=2755358 RepID=UPI00188EF429|nr:hypothetical protein [Pararhodonellum marinum]
MKNLTIYLSSLMMALLLLPTFSFAQFEVGIGYLNSTPTGMMGNFINRPAHGFSMDIAYRLPSTNFSIGLQFAESQYGYQKKEEMYRFDNGYEGNVNVEVYNYLGNNNLYLRYDIFDEGFIQPYVLFGGGISRLSTDLSIIDPREELTSDCPKPLETTTLLRDRTSNLIMGGGVRFDLSHPIKSIPKRKALLDLRINYLNGGMVSYTNLNQPSTTFTYRGENVTFDFASEAQPNVVHEYHAGTSYRTKLQLVTINAGLFIVLGNRERNNTGYSDNW